MLHSSSVISLKYSSKSLKSINSMPKKILNKNAHNILKLNSSKSIKSKKQYSNTHINDTLNINNMKYSNISNLVKQKQINKNKILLINLTSSMTELARLLVISGFNIYLYDKEIVTENDINNNIFLEENDYGKYRIDIIYKHLMTISTTVNISIIKDYTSIKDYKIAIVGFTNFNSLIEYEEYFNRKDKLFFCLNSSGLYAFFYHNLNEKNCKKFQNQENEKDKNIEFNNKYEDEERKNQENKFNKESFIAPTSFLKKSEHFFEFGKFYENDYLVFAIYLLELYYRKNIDKKNIKYVFIKEMNGDNNFVSKMYYIENFLIKKKCFDVINNQDLIATIKKFVINFNREFNPVSCVIAKMLFSTLFNFFKFNLIPKKSIITYNSDIMEYNNENFLK